MVDLNHLSEVFASNIWGLGMIILLFGAGLLFTIYLGFPQIKLFKHAIDVTAGKYDKPEDIGEISHFQALCSALSATIGLGNIAGVAVAITAGGPGAVFWMWVAGFVGMATKFTSISLALTYRKQDPKTNDVHGGPMYTITNGLGKKFYPLAIAFSIFTIFASFGGGNMFQSNQMASMLHSSAGIPTWATGVFFTLLTGVVLIGGIKRIGKVAEKLVPAMVLIYFLGALGILFTHLDMIIPLLQQIVHDAFTGTAAIGGFSGIAFKEVVIQGVRRAVFSNEAGLGSAAMAHSAAKSSPVQEGIVGMLGPFIDTIVVCSLTALVLLITGVWSKTTGLAGSELTAKAFATLYGDFGVYMITLVVVLFAFSSIISWSYYGEQGVNHLFGSKWISTYRVVFTLFVFVGSVLKLSTVINFSDAFLGLMVIPNLIGNLLLSKKVKTMLNKYRKNLSNGNV